MLSNLVGKISRLVQEQDLLYGKLQVFRVFNYIVFSFVIALFGDTILLGLYCCILSILKIC